MKKRISSIALTIAMLLVLAAGCTGGTTDQTAEVSAQTSASETPAQASEAAPSSADNTGSETAASSEVAGPWRADELITLTYWQAWPPFLSAISDPGDAMMFDELEKRLNVRLEITAVSTETSKEQFQLMCASGDYTDLIQGAARSYVGGSQKGIEDGVLVDLLPLIEEYTTAYKGYMDNDENLRKTLTNDAGCIPQLFGLYEEEYYTDQGLWIRQDFLDTVGMDIPQTVDEMQTVLTAFRDELNLSDPIVVLFKGSLNNLATAYGAVNMVEDGKVVYNLSTESYKNYMLKMHEWYENKLISIDFPTYNYSETKPPQDLVYGDKAGVFNEDVASISGYVADSDNPNFALSAVPQLLLTKGDKLTTGFIPKIVSDRYSISLSTACNEQEAAMRFLDYLYTEEGMILGNWGVEGVTYEVDANGELQFTDLILNNPDGLPFQLTQSLLINPGFPCTIDLNVERLSYNDAQLEAVDVWNSNFKSYENTLPGWSLEPEDNNSVLSYTTEETERRGALASEINTYVREMRLKFIVGDVDIEAEYDNYAKTLENLGLSEMIAIDQAAYDRYMSK